MKRLAYLDAWRGCAVLFVLAAHFGTAHFINLGRFGVELFFVLSGRLMAEILFIRETPLSIFFPRRFSRVYPAVFVFASLLLATASWRGNDPTASQYLSAITFTANYAQFWIGRSPVLDHIWSLCIEEHMYLLLGLVALVHRRKPLPLIPVFTALAAIGITIGIVQTIAGYGYYQVYWRTDVRGASLLLGVIAYLQFHEHTPRAISDQAESKIRPDRMRLLAKTKLERFRLIGKRFSAFSWTWLPVILAAFGLLLNANFVPDPIKYSLGTYCLAVSLVLMARAPHVVLRFLENPMLLRAGMWSYSIYLWQQPFAKLGGSPPLRLAHLATALLFALASFYIVESPARRHLNRIIATWHSPNSIQRDEQASN